jgi:hypothetical protein
MTKTTQIKTNKRAITLAISKFTNAYEATGKAALSIDASAKELGAALDNNGLAMLVTVSAKDDAKYENWFKTWGAIFGNDADVVQKTYDACREVIDALRKKHTALLKAGLTTEAFNTMLQRVRKHMFLSKTDKNKSKDARKRATDKANKSLFHKVQKARPQTKNGGGKSSTPKITASTFDAKCDALAKKLEVVQKAFAPINAYITDTQEERAIIKASSNITASISELIESLEAIRGAK